MKSVEDSIIKRVRRRGRGAVFTPFDFLSVGSRDSVDQGLSRLARKQVLRRVDRGIYCYPQQNDLIGEVAPSVDAVAEALARRDGAKLLPAGAMAANLLGLSEQVPVRVAYLTSGPKRVARIKNLTITLRPTIAKHLATKHLVSGIVIQALRYLGKENVDRSVVKKLRQRLDGKQGQQLLDDIAYAPAWMASVFREIAAETQPKQVRSQLTPAQNNQRSTAMFNEATRRQIEAACREFSVRALYVFGSFATGEAKPDSDLDLLVEFERDGVDGAFDQFMGFKERMEAICGRPVDLVTNKRFRNPYFEQSVEAEKQLVYAA